MATFFITCPNPDCAEEMVADDSTDRLTCPRCGERYRIATGTTGQVTKFDELLHDQGITLSSFDSSGKIAQGGMGSILAGRDRVLGRQIAVKMMLARSNATQRQQLRFITEAQITGQLEHPGIVPIHQLGRDHAGNLYYSMKLVKGRTLAELIESDEKKSTTEMLGIFRSVCDAVGFAHSRDVIHRDLKPDNIMLGEYGEVLVMDWGLAKALKSRSVLETQEVAGTESSLRLDNLIGISPDDELQFDEPAPVDPESKSDSNTIRDFRVGSNVDVSIEGQVQGTPSFMAPEQARGDLAAMGPPTDIYALGAILYFILTGESPVDGEDVMDTLRKVIRGEIVPPEQLAPERRIAPELSAIAMKAMANDPADRYQSARELTTDVQRFLDGHSVSAKADHAGEQFVKLVRRNKPIVAALVATIVITVSLTAVFIGRLMESLERAELNADSAREELRAALAAEEDMRAAQEKATAAEEAVGDEIRRTREQINRALTEQARRDRMAAEAMASTRVAAVAVGTGGLPNSAADNDQLQLQKLQSRQAIERAFATGNLADLRRNLNVVPEQDRDHEWRYHHHQAITPLHSVSITDATASLQVLDPLKPSRAFVLDTNLRHVDLSNGRTISSFTNRHRANTKMLMARSGNRLVVAPGTGLTIDIYDPVAGRKVSQIRAAARRINHHIRRIRISNDGRRLLLSTGPPPGEPDPVDERRFSVVETDTGNLIWTRSPLVANDDAQTELNCLEFTSDGGGILITHEDPDFGTGLLDATTGKPMASWQLPKAVDGRLTPLGRRVVARESGVATRIDIFDTGSETRLNAFTPFNQKLVDYLIINDEVIAAYGTDQIGGINKSMVKLFGLASGKAIETLFGVPLPTASITGPPLSLNRERTHLMLGGDKTRVWQFSAIPATRRLDLSVAPKFFALRSDSEYEHGSIETMPTRHRFDDEGQTQSLGDLLSVAPFQSRYHHLAPTGDALLLSHPVARQTTRSLRLYPALPDTDSFKKLAGQFEDVRHLHVGTNNAAVVGTFKSWAGGTRTPYAVVAWFTDTDRPQPVLLSELPSTGAECEPVLTAENTCVQLPFEVPGSTELRLIRVANAQQLKSYTLPDQSVVSATSAGGRLSAFAGESGVVRLFTGDTMDPKGEFRAHTAAITALAFHPSGPYIATGGRDGLVKVWDYREGRLMIRILTDHAIVRILTFSPSGNFLAAAGNSASVTTWRLPAPMGQPEY